MTTLARITVPTDFSESALKAAECAARLAKRFGAEVELLHVYESPVYLDVALAYASIDLDKIAVDWMYTRLAEIAKTVFSGIDVNTVAECRTSVARAIADHATKTQSDLIVIGTHGRTGVKRALMGSVAERVMRLAECDVLAVNAEASPEMVPPERILVATDLTGSSTAALQSVKGLVQSFGTDVTLLNVVDGVVPSDWTRTFATSDEMRDYALSKLDETRAQHLSDVPVVKTKVIADSRAAETICRLAKEQKIDLIIVGSHGRRGVSRLFLGSVAEKVARTAPCPTLLARVGSLED